jgi:hypothetical protein
VSLGDPSRRMLMMVWECTSTCYVLFWIVVVPARDPKDRAITGLIWVGLIEWHDVFSASQMFLA